MTNATRSTEEQPTEVLPVQVDGIWLALLASQALEVLGAVRWVPVPAATALIPGVVPWRGRPVAVLDLGAVVPDVAPLGAGSTRGRAVIAKTPHGHVMMPVDAVREVRPVTPAGVREATVTRGSRREVAVDESWMPLLALEEVVASGLEGTERPA